jgi:CubicO group peptidase (beta-lactamase class C family)
MSHTEPGRRSRFVTALLVLLLPACDSTTGLRDMPGVPEWTGDGWETASLESVGMDREPLRALLTLIGETPDHLIHGIVVVRGGTLVFEAYWPGTDLSPITLEPVDRYFDRETLHYVASVSKSITSALTGIALHRGLLESVHDSLFSFFPAYDTLRTDDNAGITLEHLLSFSSGLDWNEHVYGFDDPRDSHHRMFNTTDPLGFLLGRPVVDAPGSRFLYNSGDTNLVGEIVRRAAGAPSLVDFADEHFFGPLDIRSFDWWRFPLANEMAFASGGAFLRPRDMAKLGALYLGGGVWQGRQVVPASWVEASIAVATPLEGEYRTVYGYGYNWWLGRSSFRGGRTEYFRASGWGGQEVYAFPALDLVVVFTAGGYYAAGPLNVNDLLEDFILPAVRD